jgi:SAM-dependent methyltransferase
MTTEQQTETAADIAALAALLEIAEELGVSPLLDRGAPFTIEEFASAAQTSPARAGAFLEAVVAAGLVERDDDHDSFMPCADMADRRYQAGYVSWALTANRPYISHGAEFVRDPDAAGAKYHRDGRWVAVSSRWVGSQGFYPNAFAEIIEQRPSRVVDLGAGTAGLPIHVLRTLPDSSAVAIDLNPDACAEAERAAKRAGVHDRLQVVNRPIESLVKDPAPLHGADVVHAGFVMHDLVGAPATFDAVLRTCRASLGDNGRLLVTDAVPYATDERERAFSALFTYLHTASMAVRLPTEDMWLSAFRRAGFTDVSCTRLRMPTSRLFIASTGRQDVS